MRRRFGECSSVGALGSGRDGINSIPGHGWLKHAGVMLCSTETFLERHRMLMNVEQQQQYRARLRPGSCLQIQDMTRG